MEAYYQPDVEIGVFELSPDESRHCLRVLRRKSGDKIKVVDGKGSVYIAVIEDDNPKRCTFNIVKRKFHEPKKYYISIALSPTKNIDRTEWFVEKAVELGVNEINFYFSKHAERKKLNLDRIHKKAISAMKQSGQYYLPDVKMYNQLKDCIASNTSKAQQFIAYVDTENHEHLIDHVKKNTSYAVYIGPEGDFSTDELQYALEKGCKKVSLGPSTLRTETAGIAACHVLNLINR